jgi:hypothetical protein
MLEVGEYFHTSHEEYSDYGIGQHYQVLKPLCFVETVREWIILDGIDSSSIEIEKNSFRFDSSNYFTEDSSAPTETKFFEYLVNMGYLELLEFKEFHTGSYGSFDLAN